MEWLQFIGRFHPLLVHLPIGFLILGFLMEVASRRKRFANLASGIEFTLVIGMLASFGAVFTGYWLASKGDYEANLLSDHRLMGYGVAIFNVLVYLLYKFKSGNKVINILYFVSFTGLMILISMAGHYGGGLTHGSNFIEEGVPNSLRPVFGIPLKKEKKAVSKEEFEKSSLYKTVIQAILDKKCVSCHKSSKIKGGLQLQNAEMLLKGGDSGLVLSPGNGDNSLMIQHVLLPIEDEKHMPPKGKVQLTKAEIKAIRFWIDEGANVTKSIGEFVLDDEALHSFIYGFAGSGEPLKPIDESVLNKLAAKGYPVLRTDEKRNAVSLTLARRNDLSGNFLKQLSPVKEQLEELILKSSNVTDADLKTISQFKNLKRLDISETDITSQSLKFIAKLPLLEYLNLYKTGVNDDGVSSIKQIKTLRSLYVWKSEISEKGIKELENQLDQLALNNGVSKDVFGVSQLNLPKIFSTKVLFKDTLEVKLGSEFSNDPIYYTLDGSTPDANSQRYDKPIIMNSSSVIKAVSIKKGWLDSEVNKLEVIQAKVPIKSASYSINPNEKYIAKKEESLTDLVAGTGKYSSGNWLGWQGKDVTITVNLAQNQKVKGVTFGSLTDTRSWIFPPKSFEVFVSADGSSFNKVDQIEWVTPEIHNDAGEEWLKSEFEAKDCVALKIKVNGQLKNPSWHEAPGKPCWLFIDEVIVF